MPGPESFLYIYILYFCVFGELDLWVQIFLAERLRAFLNHGRWLPVADLLLVDPDQHVAAVAAVLNLVDAGLHQGDETVKVRVTQALRESQDC